MYLARPSDTPSRLNLGYLSFRFSFLNLFFFSLYSPLILFIPFSFSSFFFFPFPFFSSPLSLSLTSPPHSPIPLFFFSLRTFLLLTLPSLPPSPLLLLHVPYSFFPAHSFRSIRSNEYQPTISPISTSIHFTLLLPSLSLDISFLSRIPSLPFFLVFIFPFRWFFQLFLNSFFCFLLFHFPIFFSLFP